MTLVSAIVPALVLSVLGLACAGPGGVGPNGCFDEFFDGHHPRG